jgi:hypothetical protein
MRDPRLAKPWQRTMWQGHITIFPALTTTDVDQHARTINMWDLQLGALLQAQPTGVEGGEADAVAEPSDTAENRSHLFGAQDHWQFFLARGADEGEGGPVSVKGILEEELDATPCNRARAPRVRLDMLEVEEILAEFFLGDHVGGLVIVLSQLPYGPDVHLLSTFRQTPELKALHHALAQLGPGYTSSDVGDGSHRKYRSTELATA